MIKDAIAKLVSNETLSRQEAAAAMGQFEILLADVRDTDPREIELIERMEFEIARTWSSGTGPAATRNCFNKRPRLSW